MTIATTVNELLIEKGMDYDLVTHPHTEYSMKTAESAHIPGDRLAKSVVLEDELGYMMAVLPATHRLELDTLQQRFQRRLCLAKEAELGPLFEDCELGAIPPTGYAYGMETVMEESLLDQPDIYFEAGDHEELIHLSNDQFRSLMAESQRGHISYHL